MRGLVARQAVQHLQAGRHREALALLREHGQGSASLALLEAGFLCEAECILCTCEADLGQCPVTADYDPAKSQCPQMGVPRGQVGERKVA
jgi:hypothetical protein